MSPDGGGRERDDTAPAVEPAALSPLEGPPRRRRRRGRIVLAAVVALVALGVVGAALVPRSNGERSGGARGQAPDFHLPDVRNPSDSLSMAQFRGHPVVLNFWASWCEPCKREMPALEAVYRGVHSRIRFVGIDHQDARSDALQFLRQTGVTYPSAYDPDGATARAYGLFGLPTTVFVSADGRVLERKTGELTRQDLEERLARLFPPEGR